MLGMATDFESLVQFYFDGDAQILTWPIVEVKEYADAYLGLDDPGMPESVRELYVYNPEKSMQLLAEAGYPDGFKTSVVLAITDADYYSILADMWAKVGIELTLDVKEPGDYSHISSSRSYDQMIRKNMRPIGGLYTAMNYWGENHANASYVNSPVVDEARTQMQIAVVFGNIPEADQIHKELMKYLLDQAYVIPNPAPPKWNFWTPWIKNYAGETQIGYFETWGREYIWIDQDLKKSMGY